MTSLPSPISSGSRLRPARHFFPRSHRLYARFEDRPTADAALAALAEAGFAIEDTWFFVGAAGAAELDPGEAIGFARILSWWMSDNIERFQDLGKAASSGQVVVALPARKGGVAEEIASLLPALGGEGFIYTTHGNFVPISPISSSSL